MKYRVNFGQGQVSHTLKSAAEAKRYIEQSKRYGSDPYVHRYFIEFWDPAGGWFPVAPHAVKSKRQ